MMSESAPPKSTSSPPSFEVGEEDVVAGATFDDVLPAAAADRVVAAVAGEPIVGAVAEDRIGIGSSVDDVLQISSVEYGHDGLPFTIERPSCGRGGFVCYGPFPVHLTNHARVACEE